MSVGFQIPDFDSMTEPDTLTEAEESNDATTAGPSRQNGPRLVLELSSLRNAALGYNSNRTGNSQPLYRSLTRMEKRAIKIPDAELESHEQGQAFAEEFNRKMKLQIESAPRSGDKLTLLKTFATSGCILFIIDLSPLEKTTIEQDVLRMVYCLPSHLQRKEMVITFPSFFALVKDKRLVHISVRPMHKSRGIDVARRTGRMTDPMTIEPTEVKLIEPPCVAAGNDEQITIYTKSNNDDLQQRLIATIGSKVCQEKHIDKNTLHTKIEIPKESGSHSGSVRVLKNGFHNQPIVSDRASFLILKKEVAAEFNHTYEQLVRDASLECKTTTDSLEIRASVWSQIIKPLQDDLDFLLSQDPNEIRRKIGNSSQTRELYNTLIQRVFKFFVDARMLASLSYFCRLFGGKGLYIKDGTIDDAHLVNSLDDDHCWNKEHDLHGKRDSNSLCVESKNRPMSCSLLKTEKFLSCKVEPPNQVLSMV